MLKKRTLVQAFFVILTFVGVFIVKGNAERWCPFGGIEGLYTYLHEGNMVCSLGISNFYMLGAVLLITLLLRRAFCGYVCPIGTLSDWLRRLGSKVGIKAIQVPAGADKLLSLLKYGVLIAILTVTWKTGELMFRGYDPCYALISRHGEDIAFWSYGVLVLVAIVSIFMVIPFCRWLCPLGALLNPISRLGAMGITRHEEVCIDCGKCAKACPTAIPVDKIKTVKESRCLSCLNCVDTCPVRDKGALSWGRFNTKGSARPQTVIIGLIVLIFALAVGGVYLAPMPSFVHERGDFPVHTESVDLNITGVKCRGSATLLVFFLDRDDVYSIPGYLKIEAWPDPRQAKVHITWDPEQVDKQAIYDAIVEPYYDSVDDRWRNSPFEIEGYDPLNLDI